ncbi:hypothetical protein CS063_10205 [Sporanaerobium hydrogeniformans]|uniref:Uncharacterized protein n=2 Tax=Sporanaerobium hydrogeniformans TaxID=3072179 RepID=A0AC61DB80_9FIRM|nr:hypothetical protein CS063_10205 [Sporanaerobium hydrogeniformans]
MVVAAMLCAIGIMIPMISPIKVIIEPASFTLASHVAIFIALFISPMTALFVALGTTAGFFLAGFPPQVVLRALSHVLFAVGGALYLAKRPETMSKPVNMTVFGMILAVIHAVSEVLIVLPFYMSGTASSNTWYVLFGLVGLGTVVHSMIDYTLSIAVWKVVAKVSNVGMKRSNKAC